MTKYEKGLTLIEVLLVVVIIGVLAGIGIPKYKKHLERTNYISTLDELRKIERDVIVFKTEHGRYPDDLSEVFLDDLKDPWGNPYQYFNIAKATGNGKLRKDHKNVPVNKDFDLYSMGPDGDSKSPFTAEASRDDIVRANDGAFWGKVSDY